jgi:RHS repeat-associated protein
VLPVKTTETFFATMESEAALRSNITGGTVNNIMADRTHISRPDLASATVVLNEAAWTNSSRPAGPVIGLAVSPGDVININVWTFYNGGDFGNTPLDIVAAIATAFGGVSGAPGEAGKIFTNVTNGFTGALGSSTTSTLPSAFLTWVVYDRNFNRVTFGSRGVTTANVQEQLVSPAITIEQPGYIYISLYNRSNSTNFVYFDDLTVTQAHSRVVVGSDFYPFGLVMDGTEITDEPYRYGYQGQFSEKDLTTGWNEFELRMYDARFGRWLSPDPYGQFASPYVGMGNNPVVAIDPTGGCVPPCGVSAANMALAEQFAITATRMGAEVANIAVAGIKGLMTYSQSVNYANEVNINAPSGMLGNYQEPRPQYNYNQGPISQVNPVAVEGLPGTISAPGFAESLIPIWGSGREAAAAFSAGNYWTGAAYTALAISDIFLVKSIATGLARGAWKLGSHAWKPTRAWYGKSYNLAKGTQVHHWAISQQTIKKYGWQSWANQPWNLKPILSTQTFSSQTRHLAIHGKSRALYFNTGERLWYGTPTWFKAGTISGAGRVPGFFD